MALTVIFALAASMVLSVTLMPALASASNINLAGILHGEHEIIFHNPIPPEGTLSTAGAITHYYDKGKDKGALIVARSDSVDAGGRKLFTNIVTIFGRLDGGFGGSAAGAGTPGFSADLTLAIAEFGPCVPTENCTAMEPGEFRLDLRCDGDSGLLQVAALDQHRPAAQGQHRADRRSSAGRASR